MMRIEGEGREELLALMRALSGALTATEAAQQMGVSRKTFYERARRMLAGAQTALLRKPAGRPLKVRDTEQEALLAQVTQLTREKLELQRLLRVREVLQKARIEDGSGTKKKASATGGGDRGGRDRAH